MQSDILISSLIYYSYDSAVGFLKQRFKKTKRYFKQEEVRTHSVLKRLKRIKREQEKIFRQCKDPLIKEISLMFQEFGFYRFQLKTCWAGAEFLCLPLLQRIALLMDISTKEMCNTYTVQDILSFLKYKKKLSRKKTKDRKRCKESLELQGTSANPGVYKGQVRIVSSTQVQDLFIKKGEVLVTDMIQPHMILIMKKAEAIVTNQGGITSHASIMAREFRIPCVVGTLKATKVLKDGDFVEVDGGTGIIRKLKEQ